MKNYLLLLLFLFSFLHLDAQKRQDGETPKFSDESKTLKKITGWFYNGTKWVENKSLLYRKKAKYEVRTAPNIKEIQLRKMILNDQNHYFFYHKYLSTSWEYPELEVGLKQQIVSSYYLIDKDKYDLMKDALVEKNNEVLFLKVKIARSYNNFGYSDENQAVAAKRLIEEVEYLFNVMYIPLTAQELEGKQIVRFLLPDEHSTFLEKGYKEETEVFELIKEKFNNSYYEMEIEDFEKLLID